MKKIILMMIFFGISISLYAEVNNDYTDFIENDLLKVNYSFWEGYKLSLGENIYDLGMFSGDDLNSILGKYEDSKQSFERYRFKKILGNSLLLAGATSFCGSSIYKVNSNENNYNSVLYTGLFAGGLVIEFIGVIISNISLSDLYDSINLYNENTAKNY